MKLLSVALLLVMATGAASAQSILNRAQSVAASQGITAPSLSSFPALSKPATPSDANVLSSLFF